MSQSIKLAPGAPLAEEPQTIPLRRQRRLTIRGGDGDDQVVEIRAPGGQVELRIALTEDGPVLQLDAVKLALTASESVAIDSRRFEVRASEGATIHSGGDLELEAEGENRMTSTGDTRIVGKLIFLN